VYPDRSPSRRSRAMPSILPEPHSANVGMSRDQDHITVLLDALRTQLLPPTGISTAFD
jgi:hypothetical protein